MVLPRWGLKPETKIIRGGYDEWTTNDIDYVHYYQAGPATMHLPSMVRKISRPGPVAIGRNAVSEDGIYSYIYIPKRPF